MAGFGNLIERINRTLQEAAAQQPGDDLRARLGYGTGDDDEEELESDSIWEPETNREPEPARRPVTARESGTDRAQETAPKPGTPWAPKAARSSAPRPTPAVGQTLDPHRSSLTDSPLRSELSSRTTASPHSQVHPTSFLARRVRARLGTPDALREAFVVKELLDRPLGLRRRK